MANIEFYDSINITLDNVQDTMIQQQHEQQKSILLSEPVSSTSRQYNSNLWSRRNITLSKCISVALLVLVTQVQDTNATNTAIQHIIEPNSGSISSQQHVAYNEILTPVNHKDNDKHLMSLIGILVTRLTGGTTTTAAVTTLAPTTTLQPTNSSTTAASSNITTTQPATTLAPTTQPVTTSSSSTSSCV